MELKCSTPSVRAQAEEAGAALDATRRALSEIAEFVGGPDEGSTAECAMVPGRPDNLPALLGAVVSLTHRCRTLTLNVANQLGCGPGVAQAADRPQVGGIRR